MQGFGTTAQERCQQEINVIVNGLDEDLKAIRRQIVENYHFVVPKPALHFVARIEGAVAAAAEHIEEIQHYWNREKTTWT